MKVPAFVIAFALLFGGTAVAYAQTGAPQGGPGNGRPPMMQGGDHPGQGMPGRPGGNMGSTTWKGGQGMRMGSSTDMRGVPGTITALGTNSFTMDTRGMGNEHATTTFTVNVSSTTTYHHASTTASFADLTVGTKVEVMGAVATSTKTITAERVVFGMPDHGEGKGMIQQGGKEQGGFLGKLKSFFNMFGGKKGDDQGQNQDGDTENGGPAAAGSPLDTVLHTLFGWL